MTDQPRCNCRPGDPYECFRAGKTQAECARYAIPPRCRCRCHVFAPIRTATTQHGAERRDG